MNQYLYIFSNPSMPGLVKIGKTTTSPHQRMSELHTTGVPTPFVIEFVAEVDNCHRAEHLAHIKLRQYRVSGNREFFNISVEDALSQIIPEIGYFQLVTAKSSYGVEQIQQKLEEKKNQARLIEQEARRIKQQQIEANRPRIEQITKEIETEILKYASLGTRPSAPKRFDESGLLLGLSFLLILPGLIISLTHTELGLIILAIASTPWIIVLMQKDSHDNYAKAIAPFEKIDSRISELKSELFKLENGPH